MLVVYGLGAHFKKIYMRTFASTWHPLPWAYLRIFMVINGLFNFCRFFQTWFFCSWWKKQGLGCFIAWVWIQVHFVDDAKYSLSNQQSQINLINPKLLFCCSWSLVTSQFFNWVSLHARLKSHYEGWSYKKKKKMKIIEETV